MKGCTMKITFWLASAFFLYCSASYASSDKVTWSLDSLELSVEQGQVKEVELVINNVPDVEGVKLYVVPALQQWISITPSYIEDTSTKQAHTVFVVINIPSDEDLKTVDGVIQVREVKAGKPKHVLPSPLPVVLTISPSSNLPLPPTPGPENDLTIAGVDSDEDGVRDDIQRHIGLSYSSDEASRLALMDVAKALQLILIQAESKDASYENLLRFERAFECTVYVMDENYVRAVGEIISQQMSTRERTARYSRFHEQIAGVVSKGSKYSEFYKSCSFDAKTLMEYEL